MYSFELFLFHEVCVQNQWGGAGGHKLLSFILFVETQESSENIMFLLPEGWLQWDDFGFWSWSFSKKCGSGVRTV